MPEADSRPLLQGLRVLDLSRDVAGAYCTRILAGLGAEVLKVEPPEGDPLRHRGPFWQDIPHPEGSALFLYLNTSKKGITLDTSCPTGHALLRRLLAGADLLVEDLGPEGRQAAGLDLPALTEEFPRLVVVSITPWGEEGPYSRYRLPPFIAMAVSGMMYVTGDPDREPLRNGNLNLPLYGAGQWALAAALAGLYARQATGRGGVARVSVAGCEAAILEVLPIMWIIEGAPPVRLGNWEGRACWGIYPCRDGYVGVVLGRREQLRTLGRLLDIPEFDEPRFDDFYWGYSQHQDEINALLVDRLGSWSREELYHRAQALHLPFGYICDPRDLLGSQHLRERGFFVELEHPRTGPLPYPSGPFRVEGMAWQWRRAPLLGEHNRDVYCGELGLSPGDLVHLRASGVI